MVHLSAKSKPLGTEIRFELVPCGSPFMLLITKSQALSGTKLKHKHANLSFVFLKSSQGYLQDTIQSCLIGWSGEQT